MYGVGTGMMPKQAGASGMQATGCGVTPFQMGSFVEDATHIGESMLDPQVDHTPLPVEDSYVEAAGSISLREYVEPIELREDDLLDEDGSEDDKPRWPRGKWWGKVIQAILVVLGLIVSVASAGRLKNRGNHTATISHPECLGDRPKSLERSADRYVRSCRKNGGKPSVKYLRKDFLKTGTKCSGGTFIHEVTIICTGAPFDKELMNTGKQTYPTFIMTPRAGSSMARDIVKAHNKYRSVFNAKYPKARRLKPMAWKDSLALSAEGWVKHLIKLGATKVVHSDPSKTGQGENIAVGDANSYTSVDFVNEWGREGGDFLLGEFPNGVSKTGNYTHVSHYTQLVWSDSIYVGCALGRYKAKDIFVCRYEKPGNVQGTNPWLASLSLFIEHPDYLATMTLP